MERKFQDCLWKDKKHQIMKQETALSVHWPVHGVPEEKIEGNKG